jgi:hypothetical protein
MAEDSVLRSKALHNRVSSNNLAPAYECGFRLLLLELKVRMLRRAINKFQEQLVTGPQSIEKRYGKYCFQARGR